MVTIKSYFCDWLKIINASSLVIQGGFKICLHLPIRLELISLKWMLLRLVLVAMIETISKDN